MLGEEKPGAGNAGPRKSSHAKYNGTAHSPQDAREQIRELFTQNGFVPPREIDFNGKFHHFSPSGKSDDDAATYAVHLSPFRC